MLSLVKWGNRGRSASCLVWHLPPQSQKGWGEGTSSTSVFTDSVTNIGFRNPEGLLSVTNSDLWDSAFGYLNLVPWAHYMESVQTRVKQYPENLGNMLSPLPLPKVEIGASTPLRVSFFLCPVEESGNKLCNSLPAVQLMREKNDGYR